MSADQSSANADAESAKQVYRPSIRPPVVLLVLTILVAISVGAYILNAGYERSTEELLLWVLGLIAVLLCLRLLVKIFVLTRTKYVITPTQLRREFNMFYRMRTREIPLSQLRGVELSRDTSQALFGFGNLRFLTAGTNQSLGFLKFEQVPDPVEKRDAIREKMTLDQ